MSYRDYIRNRSDGEIRLNVYITSPESITKPEDIARRDSWTAHSIAELESALENLREYRKDLAARYSQLVTMAYSERLEVERSPHWKGHIEYIVRIIRKYEDGKEVDQLREVFPGKERRKALERFEEIRKSRPGIPAEKKLEKRSWER